MSDAGRQSLTDKATAALKVCQSIMTSSIDCSPIFQPDSEKTTTEHLGDKITGKVRPPSRCRLDRV